MFSTVGVDAVSCQPVPSGAREVHPGGQPISHSENTGFNSGSEPRESSKDFNPPVKLGSPRRMVRKCSIQRRVCWESMNCIAFPGRPAASSFADGVSQFRPVTPPRHDVEPRPLLYGPDFRRCVQSDSSCETSAAKIIPHLSQSESQVPAHVFEDAPID